MFTVKRMKHWDYESTSAINSNPIVVHNRAPVKCGSTIRLMHVSTRRNLHSHHFSSPLSHNQEVSCFGDDGVGDDGKFI